LYSKVAFSKIHGFVQQRQQIIASQWCNVVHYAVQYVTLRCIWHYRVEKSLHWKMIALQD